MDQEARARILADNPPLDKRLIEWLRALCPPRCIGVGESTEAAHRYAGKVELVEYLSDLYKMQNEPAEDVA